MDNRYAKIMKLAENIIKAANGMDMGGFVTAVCITVDMLCTAYDIDARQVAEEIRDRIVSINEFADNHMAN